jgi:hypothetical protein
MNDTAKIIAGKPNTQNSQETVASTKLLQILVSCPLRDHSGTLAQRSVPLLLGTMAWLLQIFPLYGEDAARGDHPDLR